MSEIRSVGAEVAMTRKVIRRLSFIDGLRGLAATFVVVSHCWDTWAVTGKTTSPGLRNLTAPLGLGRWAVTLFIVLSGVSLGLPVWQGSAGWPGGIKRFAVGRAKRIVPPYWAAVLLSSIVAATVLSSDGHTLYDPTNNIRFLGVLDHLALLQDVVWAGPAGSTAFWSIAIEFHIYVVLAFLLVAVERFPLCWLPASQAFALSALWSIWSHGSVSGELKNFHLGLYALFFLGFGAAQRGSAHSAILPRWGWFMALGSVEIYGLFGVFITRRDLDVLGPVSDLVIGPILVLAVGEMVQGNLASLGRLLSRRALLWLGASSYSLYLIHAPVVEGVWRILIAVGLRRGELAALVCEIVFGSVISVIVARVFYVLIERPFMNNRPESGSIEHGPVDRY